MIMDMQKWNRQSNTYYVELLDLQNKIMRKNHVQREIIKS